MIHPSDAEPMRPIWKFSSFFDGPIEYQCYQKCLPMIPSQPQMMVDLCNKICPFRPEVPECVKCAQIYSQVAGVGTAADDFKKTINQPEAIVVEPQSHAIMFTPEILDAGYERKQCCYMDSCSYVPMNEPCEPRCYEPCDSVCTGHCFENPQCPGECERVRMEQYKLQYRIWLSQKLNAIKQKYRAMATACLLRTRLAYVGEVQNYYQMARAAMGGMAPVTQGIYMDEGEESDDGWQRDLEEDEDGFQ